MARRGAGLSLVRVRSSGDRAEAFEASGRGFESLRAHRLRPLWPKGLDPATTQTRRLLVAHAWPNVRKEIEVRVIARWEQWPLEPMPYSVSRARHGPQASA